MIFQLLFSIMPDEGTKCCVFQNENSHWLMSMPLIFTCKCKWPIVTQHLVEDLLLRSKVYKIL